MFDVLTGGSGAAFATTSLASTRATTIAASVETRIRGGHV
jgi:hypothetical protein